jgi:anti-sigma factor (TIGR02949 family)
MSCGNPHEVDCSDVLAQVYEFIDHEMRDDDDVATVRRHLDECSPCLAEFGLEQAVKSLVKRSCGCDTVPPDLRRKVLDRIRQVQADIATSSSEAVAAD